MRRTRGDGERETGVLGLPGRDTVCLLSVRVGDSGIETTASWGSISCVAPGGGMMVTVWSGGPCGPWTIIGLLSIPGAGIIKV